MIEFWAKNWVRGLQPSLTASIACAPKAKKGEVVNRLILIGAGGHGRSVADCAITSRRWSEVCFIDDRFPTLKETLGWPVVGGLDTPIDGDFAVAVGDNSSRRSLTNTHAYSSLVTVAHMQALVSERAEVGIGSVLMAGAVINAGSLIGRGAIINTNATIDHDCTLGDFCHVSPGAQLAGGVSVGDLAWIGIGASVIEGVTIGSGAVVGAGSTVICDVSAGSTVAGVPARPIER